MSDYTNGVRRISKVLEDHSSKIDVLENILIDGFNKTHNGLKDVANEIKLTRDSGFIPAPIVEKLLEHNNATNQKNSDKFFKLVILILAVIVGVKALLPNLFGL